MNVLSLSLLGTFRKPIFGPQKHLHDRFSIVFYFYDHLFPEIQGFNFHNFILKKAAGLSYISHIHYRMCYAFTLACRKYVNIHVIA